MFLKLLLPKLIPILEITFIFQCIELLHRHNVVWIITKGQSVLLRFHAMKKVAAIGLSIHASSFNEKS
jgi:hypothetical protein